MKVIKQYSDFVQNTEFLSTRYLRGCYGCYLKAKLK